MNWFLNDAYIDLHLRQWKRERERRHLVRLVRLARSEAPVRSVRLSPLRRLGALLLAASTARRS